MLKIGKSFYQCEMYLEILEMPIGKIINFIQNLNKKD